MSEDRMSQMAEAAVSKVDPKFKPRYDLQGVLSELSSRGIGVESVRDVSWVRFCDAANVQANFGDSGLAVFHPGGVLVTDGVPAGLRKRVKVNELTFPPCVGYAPNEYVDERNYGKYAIEFGGPGNVFLGRLEWLWTARRFSDPREKMMAAATERDRMLAVVQELFQ